jgi:hypothetical protein
MLRNTALSSPGADRGDLRIVSLLQGPVGFRGQLDKGVKGNGHPGRVGLGFLHEVGVDAAEDSLVGHDQDVLRAFQFHDDRLQADNDVSVSEGY